MNAKDLKIEFRYLTGNIACMSVDSVSGNPVHNDIDNEEAIILFNSLVGEKEGCQTLKTLLKENQQLKDRINKAIKLIEEIQHFPHTNINQHRDLKELKEILKEDNKEEK